MRRLPILLGALIAAGILFWLAPPFRIVRLDEVRRKQQESVFDASAFVTDFWTNQLMASLDQATDASALLEDLRQNPSAARESYGRTVGLGNSANYFLQATGTVVSVEGSSVGVSLQGTSGPPEILLQTGLIFGNSVRDATGLLDVSKFPNSQQFNAISSELNALVETQVIPSVRSNAAPGRALRFVGCAQIADDASDIVPLNVVPLEVIFLTGEANGPSRNEGGQP